MDDWREPDSATAVFHAKPAASAEVPRLAAPVVLVPGLLGFDALRLFGLPLADYFVGIPDYLAAPGNRVRVVPIGNAPVAVRARRLRAFLDRTFPGELVHLIAHSSSGLDARYLLTHLDGVGRVASLTTVAAPHRGSALSSWILRHWRWSGPLVRLLGLTRETLAETTPEACREFNDRTPDVPGVRYFAVAARLEPDWLSPHWRFLKRIVDAEGPNDGMVSVASAAWGEETELWEGSHLALANWPYPLGELRALWADRRPQYAGLLRRLADLGY